MIVDVNVSLHRWPFRRLKGDEPSEMVTKLRAQNVSQAWAGSFDALDDVVAGLRDSAHGMAEAHSWLTPELAAPGVITL